MGLLGSLFGSEKNHPPLDATSSVASRLEKDREMLEGFANRVKDKLEVVPGERGMYVFVGKPPGAFGIVWFHDGAESNFKILMKDKGLTPQKVQLLSDELRDAYKRHTEEPRYAWTLAGRSVTVTPSPALAQEVGGIIGQVTS